MNSKECEEQLESLVEAWQLNEADLNQTDIEAIKHLMLENQMQHNEINKLKHILDELEKYLEEFDKSLCETMVGDNSEFYHFQRGELVFLRNTKLKIKELRGRENENSK